ncbi:MAG: ABC transporter ATP-binding protein [Phycisphaerales bacterium JB050]
MSRNSRKRRSHIFWEFARELLHRRIGLAVALAFALLSAVSMGAGLGALVGVLNLVNPEPLEPGEIAPTPSERVQQALDGLPGGIELPQPIVDLIPKDPLGAVVAMVIGLSILTVIGAAANFIHQYLSITICTHAVARIRSRVYAHILALPLSSVVSGDSADRISRLLRDTQMLNVGFIAITSRATAQVTKGAVMLIVAIIIDWRLSLVTLAVGPVIAIIIRKFGKRIMRGIRGAMQGQARLLGNATEAVHGFRVVKVYGSESHELDRFNVVNEHVVREELKARTAKALSSPLVEALTILVIGGLVIIAARAIYNGGLTVGQFIGALGALAVAGQSLKPLNGVIQEVQAAEASAERVKELLDEPIERDLQRANKPVPRHAKTILFESVKLTYPGAEHPAVNGLDLTVNYGETVAVVGPNGSGKTSLLSLVPALYTPTEGRILIDGVDLAEADLASLRKQIAVVTQEVVLFAGTVAENIAYARPDATRQQVEDAARRAHALNFINDMPGGLDATVGDRGLTLSGGQRQRIAIARAILRDPAILIMDEATSMIDTQSEAEITQAIAEFGTGRTVLVVAHRLATVMNADRIVVMDAGKVVDIGTHTELLERCPLYAGLASHQLVAEK